MLRGFDVVFDGIGANGNPRSLAALKRVGLLCACCYSAGAQARRRLLTMLMWMARLELWSWLTGGKGAWFDSINVMKARHLAWFRDDPERLFRAAGKLARSGRASPSASPSVRSRHIAVSRRVVSKAKLLFCRDLPS